jgi:hypothetical protein
VTLPSKEDVWLNSSGLFVAVNGFFMPFEVKQRIASAIPGIMGIGVILKCPIEAGNCLLVLFRITLYFSLLIPTVILNLDAISTLTHEQFWELP